MLICIDYISFNYESEGFSLSDRAEADIIAVLEEEETADNLINNFITEKGLTKVEHVPSDKDYEYYENTICLYNFFNIKEREKLRSIAIYITSLRAAEMMVNPPKLQFNLKTLMLLHKNLFGDIYPSAGTLRTKTAAKRTEFCRPEYIIHQAREIFRKLKKDNYLKGLDRESFINDLAYYMGEVEALHPFRNGNAPTARLFFWELVNLAGYGIQWKDVDPDRLLEADICAIDGDYQPLITVLDEVVFLI